MTTALVLPSTLAVALLLLLLLHVTAVEAILENGTCSILALFPFSDGHIFTSRGELRGEVGPGFSLGSTYGEYSRWTPQTIGMTGYSYTAAAALAIQHFNARDASVVPELASLSSDQNCDDVKLDFTVQDSRLNNLASGDAILHIDDACAVLGPYSKDAAQWTTAITASQDVPQVFYSSIDDQATEPDLFRNTVRLTTKLHDTATAILSWLHQHNRDYLAVITGGGGFDKALSDTLQREGNAWNVTVRIFSLAPPGTGTTPKQNMENMIGGVKESGIRTIFRTFVDGGTEGLAMSLSRAAMKGGLLEDDYLWILEESLAPPDDLPSILGSDGVNSSSPIAELLKGSIVFSALDGWEASEDRSSFVDSWMQQNGTLVTTVNQLSPLQVDQPEYFEGAEDYFSTNMPRRGSSFVYDSVMSIGFGACRSSSTSSTSDVLPQQTSGAQGRPPPPQNTEGGTLPPPPRNSEGDTRPPPSQNNEGDTRPPPPQNNGGTGPPQNNDGGTRRLQPSKDAEAPGISNPHVIGIVQSSFTGASGQVSFGEKGERFKDRVSSAVKYGAYNIRPVVKETSDGTFVDTFTVALVSRSTPESSWVNIPGEAMTYKDGTGNLPQPTIVIGEENFIPLWARTLGLTLMSITWAVSFFLSIAVWVWSDKPLVRAGQPVFLQVLCAGSTLTSTAIFTLSFDESYGWTDGQLDVACTVTPWLFFLGIVSTFAGLFCKLWRVDQLTQFRRRQVKAMQAAWPLVLLMLSTIVCLTVWTVVDPWTWERDMISKGDAPPETYGQCTSEHFVAYIASLCAIMIIATVLAFGMAWKTKDLKIDSKFSDSNAVFLAVASQLQAWMVGLPILIVLQESSIEGTYLGRVLLIWLFAIVTVLIVVAPKIFCTWQGIRNPSLRQSKGTVTVSGLYPPSTFTNSNTSFIQRQSGYGGSTNLCLDQSMRNVEQPIDKNSNAVSFSSQTLGEF